MRTSFARIALLWFMLCNTVFADALQPENVPEPLKPWVGWVLDNQHERECPYLYNAETQQCAWSGTLTLALTDKGGSFSQSWDVYGKTHVRLAGNAQHWPLNVQVTGATTQPAVLEEDGYPTLVLEKGHYTVSGQFSWDALPENLFVAPETGLVALTLNGQVVANPEFSESGNLWLNRNNDSSTEDNLEIQVFRKIMDTHPLEVNTYMQLRVAGKQRNIELSPVLLKGFIPLQLESPLSTRMAQDGKLQVQLRAGEWTLKLTGRSVESVAELALPESQAPWASDEVWVFEADSNVRQVQVEGVPSIDPSQTRLPDEWKNLPAYLMNKGSVMKLVQQHRGLTESPAQLKLDRKMWLDFDGKGYTLQDKLTGTIGNVSRLDAVSEIQLGRVSMDGKPQLITQREKASNGIEIRQQNLNIEADSRYQADPSQAPVSGWSQEMQTVNTYLNLPVGWMLFAVTGTDNLPNTWLQQWTLLDLFLVLLVCVATGYVFNWKWGAVAALALVLTWHENDAPRLVWLNLLAVIALLKNVPEGGFKRALGVYRWLSVLLLVLILLPYSLDAVRLALYPQLAQTGYISQSDVGSSDMAPVPEPAAPAAAPAPAEVAADAVEKMEEATANSEAVAQKLDAKLGYDKGYRAAAKSALSSVSGGNSRQKANLQELDPASLIQTGPGLPKWEWNSVFLQWSGVITPEDKMRLWLIPPWLHSLLLIAGVLALTVFAVRMASDTLTLRGGFKVLRESKWWVKNSILLTGAAVLSTHLVSQPVWAETPPVATSAVAEIPQTDVLQTLEERLLRAPDCLPNCAQLESMDIAFGADTLVIKVQAHAARLVAIPLPMSQGIWQPANISVSNTPTAQVRRDESQQLWLVLPEGQHEITLQGALPTRSTFSLALPLKPHRVTWQGIGWQVDGIRENGIPESQLQLTQLDATQSTATQDMQTLPAFVRIKRRLELGLDWYVTTTVTRVSDNNVPITLSVPLIQGEQLLSDTFTVKDNTVQLNLKPQQANVEWTSRLPTSAKIQLIASKNTAWVEEWHIAANPIWHVTSDGLPVNTYTEEDAQGVLAWKPWAGEKLTLDIERPQGTQGQTITILNSQTKVAVGKRARDVSLRLTLDSSRGTQHAIQLPADVTVKSLTIDGVKQAIQQQQGKVLLPLLPRKQEAVLEWQETGSLPIRYQFPHIQLNLPSVNSESSVQLPEDRWVLWVRGPLLGPAILFWGMLLVLLVLSIALGRSNATPLKGWQWFLLCIGLSQTSIYLMLIVVGWFIALNARYKAAELKHNPFNGMQIGLVVLTFFVLLTLVGAVAKGLLGSPEMQIAGNQSYAHALNWYQDRTENALPIPSVISVPMLYYRILMLAWALWLALALLGWLRWGWNAFNVGGMWKQAPRKPVQPPVEQQPPVTPTE